MFEDTNLLRLAMMAQDEETEMLPMLAIEGDEEDDPSKPEERYPEELPLLPLKNMVLFPKIVLPITVGREKSIVAVNAAHQANKWIVVVAQREMDTEDPNQDDIYQVGVLAKVMRMMKMPDGSTTAIIQGRVRVQINELTATEPCLRARISVLHDTHINNKQEIAAVSQTIKELGEEVIDLSPNMPSEATNILRNIQNYHFLLHFVSANLNINISAKQAILETQDMRQRADLVISHLQNEIEVLQIKEQIEGKVRGELDKNQREYILNQQLKTIQDELGQNPQTSELDELEAKGKTKIWSAETATRFQKEVAKLRRMNPAMPDYSISLNYLELMTDLPWGEYTDDNFDLRSAEEILNRDHFGLDKVKDRILEYLAVLQLRNDMKAPILCLYGPPGVGKTSLGRSIAESLGRKYVRMSLGGLSDEAELRGHRKTYIGALPGRIIQSIKKAGSSNPVFILDEIDKLGVSYKGDPSSALLEILDPEQNTAFYDNYLEVEYDLSKVLFIATANSLNSVQPALLDRMEIIEVNGYSTEEKVEIARRHLIPKQLKEHGLNESHITLLDETLTAVARDYTRESGVRSLEREIAKLMRWVAVRVARSEAYQVTILPEQLEDILGMKRAFSDVYDEVQRPGVAVGLAWTAVGGDILFIEVSLSKGKGNLILSGNLGDVMKESATTALSFLRANAQLIGVDADIFDQTNVHIHVPAGGIPKDGPSAGVTMLSALASAFTKRPLRPYLAMTGEITLRGKVLPVGGLKEKTLAAKRAGITDILLCKDNQKDIKDINAQYLVGLNFHYVNSMEEVLKFALQEAK